MHEWMVIPVVVLLLGAMACSLARAALGPTRFDRILAANSFGTQTVLLLSVYFFVSGYPEYIDIALLYALINYVGVLAIVRYLSARRGGDRA